MSSALVNQFQTPKDFYTYEDGGLVELRDMSNFTQLPVVDFKLSVVNFTTLAVTSVIGLCGNGLILFLIFGSSTFRKTTNYLIANLSVASVFYVCIGIFAMIYRFTLNSWSFGLLPCKWYCFLKRLPVAIVSFTTIAINADRNHIVGNPLSLTSRQTICIQIIGIWGTACLIMTPLGITGSIKAFISSVTEKSQVSLHCIPVWTHREAQIVYSVLIFLLIHLIPVVVMILGMWKMRTKMKFLLKSPNASSDRRVKLMRNSCIFTCIFITCWLPTGIFRLPLDLPADLLHEEFRANLQYYSDVCGILGYVHTCFIPLLLFALSHDLRKHLYLTSSCLKPEIPDDPEPEGNNANQGHAVGNTEHANPDRGLGDPNGKNATIPMNQVQNV